MNETTTDEPRERVVRVGAAVQAVLSAQLMHVEASMGRGFSGLQLIGKIGKSVDDGKERARMALERLGIAMPARRLLLSVSPGDIKVDSSHFDLPFAVAIAVILEPQSTVPDVSRWVFAGEVGLDGRLKGVPGLVCQAAAALAGGFRGIVFPRENLPEMAAMEQLTSLHQSTTFSYKVCHDLAEVLSWLWGKSDEGPTRTERGECSATHAATFKPDFDDMVLDDELKDVALVAATGRHSMLVRGAPGCGKSMFARRLVSILPSLTEREHLNALQVYSCAGGVDVSDQVLAGRPPLRAPHHFTSAAAMLGTADRPGEMALASGGVLFLDEFPEFRRDVIEALREPMETGEVHVSRAQAKFVWQAKMMFVAAANNCPCGWRGSTLRRCTCPENRVQAYQNRLSGPLLDRIDLHVNMTENHAGRRIEQLSRAHFGDVTRFLRERVTQARAFSAERNLKFGVRLNADLPAQYLSDVLGLNVDETHAQVRRRIPAHASTRAMVRCLRVARTLADLEGRVRVNEEDIARSWGWQAMPSAVARGEHLGLELSRVDTRRLPQ